MEASDVLFVVPVKEGQHALYLRDGRILTISTYDGTVYYVGRIPDQAAISKAEADAKDAKPGVVGFSNVR
jgi:osmotically-inducible protein OsmY